MKRARQNHVMPATCVGRSEAVAGRKAPVAGQREAPRPLAVKPFGSRADGLVCFCIKGTMEITPSVRTIHGFPQSNIERRFAGVS